MGFGQQQVIQRYHAIRTNAAILGISIPILIGQNRLTGKLIWYGDFTSNTAKQQGGKGLGKGGSQYVYAASIMAALCHGPLHALLSVWDSTGKYVVSSQSEAYVIGSPYSYTPTYANAFTGDQGVSVNTPYSYGGINDYGSPGAITLAGNTQVGMTPVVGTPSTGQYSVNPSTGVYTFATADAGKTVQISYAFYRYQLEVEELSIVPFSGPYTVTVQNSSTYKGDLGVQYYPAGTAFKKVSSPTAVGQYSESGGVYTFYSGDAGQGIVISYAYNDPNTANNAPSNINLTLIGGAKGQSPWSYLTSKHPAQALGYTQIAAIASSQLYLGYSPELPNYTYEVAGAYQVGGGILDANPADCITAVLSDPGYGIGFPLGNIGSFTLARTCWTAYGFFISPLIENQQSTASVIGEWLEAGMVGAYWSEGLLKFVPYCDTSAVGNGVLYQPSTTPVASFTDGDYLVDDKGEDPIKVSRSPWMDAYNRVPVSYAARVNDYNPETIYEQDEASIQRYGLRQEDSQSWDFITTLTAAQYAASMRLQRNVYVRNTYEFKLPSSFAFLEPMDVITITDSALGLNAAPVRIQKIEDDPVKGLSITAEDFIWGTAAPAYNPKGTNTPPAPLPGQEDPGNASVIIFEAPGRLGLYAGNILYGFCNGSNENWGGCHVWVSFDGANYKLMATVNSPARIGALTAGLAAYGGANPDTGDTLSVKMTDETPLSSTTLAGAAANVSLCAIVSAGPTLELLSYETATLVADQKYNLTTLYRGVYGTAAGAHLMGDLFARLDEASFEYQYDPTYVGTTIYIKFTSFNLLAQNEQSLATATANSFTLLGSGPGAINLNTGFLQPSSNPNLYLGPWSNSEAYLAGNQVTYNSNFYTCLLPNTNENPATATTYWQLVSVGNTGVYLGAWSSSTAYVSGNQVTSGGNYYICTNANTNEVPPNASYWQLISGTSTEVYLGAYSGATAYVAGNQVTYQGSFWICILASTGNAPYYGSSYWTLVGTSVILLGAYNGATAYVFGNEVTYLGNIYRCILASTGNLPTNATYWQLMGTSSEFLGAWNSSTQYQIGNQVIVAGYYYICISPAIGVPDEPPLPPTTSNTWWQLVSLNQGVYLGVWNSFTTYYVGNQVEGSDGNYYICIAPTLNNPPPNVTYWKVISSGSGYTFLGAYNSGTAYVIGNQVTYQNGYYVCTANTTGNAPTNASYWQKIGSTETDMGVYSSTVTYAVGEEVMYNGMFWSCILASTGNAPAIGSSYWQLIGTTALLLAAWSSIVAYQPGTQVTYSNNVYQCVVANTNVVPTNASYWTLIGPATLDALANGTVYGKVTLTNLSSGVPYVYKGAWSSGTAYVQGNEVSYQGNYYICQLAGTGQTPNPAGTSYWVCAGPTSADAIINGAVYAMNPINSGIPMMLVNGDFQASATILPPPGWQIGGDGYIGSNCTLSYDTSTPYSGSQSLKIVATAQASGVTAIASFPVIPGEIYQISAAIKSDGSNPAYVLLRFMQSRTSASGVSEAILETSSASWQYLTAQAAVAAGGTVAVVECYAYGASGGTLEVDALRVLKVTDSHTLNPLGNTGTATASGAILAQSGTSTTINVSSFVIQYGFGQVSYNSGSVNPGSYGTFVIYFSDPYYTGGTVTFQYTTIGYTAYASDGLITVGVITTASGGGGSGGGGGGGPRGCFSGNTRIKTVEGYKRFDELPAVVVIENLTGIHEAELLVHEGEWEMLDMGSQEFVTRDHLMKHGPNWIPAEDFFSSPRRYSGKLYNLHIRSENPDDQHYVLENGMVAHNMKAYNP